MTAVVLANHHPLEISSRLSHESLPSFTMAQAPYLPWPNELTMGAQNVSATTSVQTSPSVSSFAIPSPGYAYGSQVSSSEQAEAQFALPFRPVTETDKHTSALDRLGFSKLLSSEKKTRDGQQPKRRGPKPDSKPALTRRQELNRQAQRTHRERKELYIKALEDEVLRLKELGTETFRERDASNRERDALTNEIQRLRNLLTSHGIPFDSSQLPISYAPSTESTFNSSSTSHVGSSYNPANTSSTYTGPLQVAGPASSTPPTTSQTTINQRLNYDQIGIDFVLALERPCFQHLQVLMVKSQESESEINGHTLMASCPPRSHIMENPTEQYPQRTPDIGMDDLVRLLNLSNQLPLDGQITPIMAWAGIFTHMRLNELQAQDFEALKENLMPKVRCYGFGAVLEEFELRDAMTAVLAPKGPPMLSGGDVLQLEEAEVHYHVHDVATLGIEDGNDIRRPLELQAFEQSAFTGDSSGDVQEMVMDLT